MFPVSDKHCHRVILLAHMVGLFSSSCIVLWLRSPLGTKQSPFLRVCLCSHPWSAILHLFERICHLTLLTYRNIIHRPTFVLLPTCYCVSASAPLHLCERTPLLELFYSPTFYYWADASNQIPKASLYATKSYVKTVPLFVCLFLNFYCLS